MVFPLLAGLGVAASVLSSFLGHKQEKENYMRDFSEKSARLAEDKRHIEEDRGRRRTSLSRNSRNAVGRVEEKDISDKDVEQYSGFSGNPAFDNRDYMSGPSAFGNIITGFASGLDVYNRFNQRSEPKPGYIKSGF
jgi:hypothetical protein